MRVRVEVSKENPITGTSELCTVGHFTMVAMGEDGTPARAARGMTPAHAGMLHSCTGAGRAERSR